MNKFKVGSIYKDETRKFTCYYICVAVDGLWVKRFLLTDSGLFTAGKGEYRELYIKSELANNSEEL